jgi:hypothetical protein
MPTATSLLINLIRVMLRDLRKWLGFSSRKSAPNT